MNTPSNLTLLINNSIRLHDAQQDDAGFAEHTFDDLSGPAYEMLQATYDLHNNFTTMLRGIFTDGRSAEDIIEQLRDLMAELQEHLDRATADSGAARAAELMVTTAFITELGVIASSEAPAVQSAAPADPASDEDDYQEFTREEMIEDRAVNEAHRLLQAASPLQSTPWISRLVGDVARSSVAIACQSA